AKLGESGNSGRRVILRLLKLTWRYKFQALRLTLTQLVMLAMALSGLGLIGLGIDVLRDAVSLTPADSTGPRYPFGLDPPDHYSTMSVVCLIALGILAIATFRFFLDRLNTIWKATLVQDIVV